jgi:Lar family restriction alleviation protein
MSNVYHVRYLNDRAGDPVHGIEKLISEEDFADFRSRLKSEGFECTIEYVFPDGAGYFVAVSNIGVRFVNPDGRVPGESWRVENVPEEPDLTKADTRLIPCPFCGSTRIVNWLSHDVVKNMWCVFCETCNSEGPHSENEEEAIILWNKRAEREAKPAAQ